MSKSSRSPRSRESTSRGAQFCVPRARIHRGRPRRCKALRSRCSASGATLTVIGEEFAEGSVSLDRIAGILEGAIIKRRVRGQEHGVALLAEGLIERLDPDTLGRVERDPYGNVRLEELELSRLLKERVSANLRARKIDCSIVAKDIGYELRCAPPGGFDIHYCRSLGYWATRFLIEGGTGAMATIQGEAFVAIEV